MTWYILNLHDVICQLCLSKAGKNTSDFHDSWLDPRLKKINNNKGYYYREGEENLNVDSILDNIIMSKFNFLSVAIALWLRRRMFYFLRATWCNL